MRVVKDIGIISNTSLLIITKKYYTFISAKGLFCNMSQQRHCFRLYMIVNHFKVFIEPLGAICASKSLSWDSDVTKLYVLSIALQAISVLLTLKSSWQTLSQCHIVSLQCLELPSVKFLYLWEYVSVCLYLPVFGS